MQAAAFVGLPAQRFADLRAGVAQYQAAALGVQAADDGGELRVVHGVRGGEVDLLAVRGRLHAGGGEDDRIGAQLPQKLAKALVRPGGGERAARGKGGKVDALDEVHNSS